ncbi:glycosyl hydrolase family 8, partial [Lichenibacterium dinghuense]|uniref:glycosyl hydrolase family 8 n=1 Tax=Lichenibacterium dinghuense TaxID=2895977 RepID=UPI001F00B0A2
LLLALAADDPDCFALIWRWTSDHLGVRHDGLFAWKWEPGRAVVADRNDATDGDVLIAWALAEAAQRFNRADYGVEARRIADAVAAAAVRPNALGPVLLPAAAGFGPADQPGGPVVNLSYWIFPAFRDFAALWPKSPWGGLRASGFKLLDVARFGPLGLPADWVSVAGAMPAPAHGFPATFGYDAIRIPLYLAWDGDAPPPLLSAFARFSPASDPSVIEVSTGASGSSMGGVGYRAIFALARCAARGETVPPDLMTARDTLYYPETLRLLSLSIIQERYPRCL